MKSLKVIVVLLILLDIEGIKAQEDSGRKQMNAFRNTFRKAMLEKKPSLLEHYFSSEIRLMPEFQKTVFGRKAALKYYTAFTSRFDVLTCETQETEILDLGKILLESGSFRMDVTNNGRSHKLTGKYIDLWRKENDNSFRLITSSWNYDHTSDIEDDLRFAEVPVRDVALEAHVPVNSNISFELAALNSFMEGVVTHHDAGLWTQFYSEDGTFLYSRSPAYSGKHALSEFFGEHVKSLPVFEKLDCRTDQIEDLGVYVIEYASHIAIIRHGDFSGVFTGKDLRLWKRENNGSLKIYRHIAMYD